jgi:glycosyltransferase involved in cell wall biosynthesis
MTVPATPLSYVLITPARNEEANIGRLLEAMTSQTMRPLKWVIVDDNSTDRTAEIVQAHLPRWPWIELVAMRNVRDRSFAAKVDCFNEGRRQVQGLGYDIIGNIDADVSFDRDYFEFLLGRFAADPRLGVAGTPFVEDSGYSSATDSFEGERHVAGGCQLFRRECFEDVGGYVANRQGGIDWIAVTTARMKGWTTRSFREKTFHHHRSLGTGESNARRALFSYGRKDYYLGNHPLWEAVRILYRMGKKPYIVAGLTILSGYFYEATRRADRPVSPELMRFHRREEMQKMRAIFKALVRRDRSALRQIGG